MLKQFLLFAHGYDETNGGFDDYEGDFNSIEEAKEVASDEYYDGLEFVYVIDIHNGGKATHFRQPED